MEEEIEVAPSAENGNTPVETPNEQPSTDTPAENGETVQPTEPEVKLYDLPDGRKVDAETLTREWKENFLPDYTRKSQELAKVSKGDITNDNKPTERIYDNPDWQPQTYAELIKVAKEEALLEIQAKEQEKITRQQDIENQVVEQLAEVKKLDPTVDENSLFLHANEYRQKYGVAFPNLQSAYKHMKDTSEFTKKVQKATADNIARRNDPVSVTPGATGNRPNPNDFGNAIEYLRSLK